MKINKKFFKWMLTLCLVLCMIVCLTACGEAQPSETENSAQNNYVVKVVDQEALAVEGVGVMLYTSEGEELTWMPLATNGSGKIEFDDYKQDGCYVQVKTVPIGYKLNSEEKYYFDETGKITIALENRAQDNTLENYEASIGEDRYATFTEALAMANSSQEDVTIVMAADITVTGFAIQNTFAKNITIDGNNHTITTEGGNNAIAVSQADSVIELKNMTINHKNPGSVIQSTAGQTINLTNVVINATEGTTYNYGLIHTMAANTTTNLNLTGVTVKMAVNSEAKNYPAIIRTGNNGLDQTKTVNVTVVDCDFDTTGATQRAGIRYMNSTSGEIVIKNTKIATNDAYCIEANYQPVTLENVNLRSNTEEYAKSPIKDRSLVVSDKASQAYDPGYVAKIGDVEYRALAPAFRDAYTTKGDVVIEMLANATMSGISVNGATGKKIVLEGNGYTITTEGGNNAFTVNTGGVFEFKNVIINHKNTGSVIQNMGVNTFNLTDVTINATEGEKYNYTLINFMAAGDTNYMNLIRVNIKMAVDSKGSDNYGAIIRTGHGTEEQRKTVVLNLTDCNLDTTGATGRAGILIMSTTTAYVTLTNTTIKTMDNYAIRANHQTFIMNNTKVGSDLPIFNQYPIENDSNVVKQK